MDWKRETILHEVEHCMYKQMEKIMDEDELDSRTWTISRTAWKTSA